MIGPMTSVHLVHAGYAADRVGSSISLVRVGDALIVADPGMVAPRALTHLWWRDRTPEIDPLAWDRGALERGRLRVVAAADVVVPGHGAPFRVSPGERAGTGGR